MATDPRDRLVIRAIAMSDLQSFLVVVFGPLFVLTGAISFGLLIALALGAAFVNLFQNE